MDALVEDPVTLDPRVNLALDEALVRARPGTPLLRTWLDDRCVVVGRGQQIAREIDVAACERDGVGVYRRSSGGGTVYHDPGNLNVTLVCPGRYRAPAGELAALIVDAVRGLGLVVSSDQRGVYALGAKLSGLAAQVTAAATLAHATLMVTTPADLMWTYLKPAPADRRPLDSVRSPVSALRAHLPGIDLETVRGAVLRAAAHRFGRLEPRPATVAERRWRDRLLAERYASTSWHQTGHRAAPPKEAPWRTRPVSTCTA